MIFFMDQHFINKIII